MENKFRNDFTNKTMEQEIHDSLSRKLISEFEKMRHEMLGDNNISLFDDHYEITLKDELKDTVLYMGLGVDDMKLLLKQKDVLTELYRDWLDTDVSFSDVLEDTVRTTIDKYKELEDKNKSSKETDKEAR